MRTSALHDCSPLAAEFCKRAARASFRFLRAALRFIANLRRIPVGRFLEKNERPRMNRKDRPRSPSDNGASILDTSMPEKGTQ
jgi:hypothetical protein